MSKGVFIEPLPVKQKMHVDTSRLFSYKTCAVAVNYYVVDPKRKMIVSFGSSKPCGFNHNRSSIHAEQRAIYYCLAHDRNHRYQIYISRYSRQGTHKPIFCCAACDQLVKKYQFQDRVYTVTEDHEILSALSENPRTSLAHKIKQNIY